MKTVFVIDYGLMQARAYRDVTRIIGLNGGLLLYFADRPEEYVNPHPGVLIGVDDEW